MSENTLFADSLLETSWAQRSRRSLTTLTSFAVEAVALVLLLLVPLWRTVGMPSARTLSTPISLGQPVPVPRSPTPRTSVPATAQGHAALPLLVAPGRVPQIVSRVSDGPSSPTEGGPSPGIYTGVSGDPAGIPNSLISGSRPMMPTRPAPMVRALRTSTMQEGNLIRRVIPPYPYPAKVARVEGMVLLSAVISKGGAIENLQVIKGHPLLVPAAIEAVKQWRYRPYILNNEPVEVETQIAVNFTLSGN